MKEYQKHYPFKYDGFNETRKDLCVIKNDSLFSKHYCGYVVFHNRNIPKKWQGNYDADALQYLSVHGGITYCEKVGNYTVFGFDCAHYSDEDNHQLKDIKYVFMLTAQMKQQIKEYADNYKKYKAYKTKRGRINFVQKIMDASEINCALGFGGLIGVMSGASEFDK